MAGLRMPASALVCGVCVLALAGFSAAGIVRATANEPIVGLWGRSDGRAVRVTGSGGSFTGRIARTSGSCLKTGAVVWRVRGSGNSYSGTMYWYDTSTCASLGWGKATWKLNGLDSLTHCTFNPKGENTGCGDYRRAEPLPTTTTTATTTAPPDTSPPKIRTDPTGFTAPGSTRPGRVYNLGFVLGDDSGKATVTATLYEGGEQVTRSVSKPGAARGQRGTWRAVFAADLVGPLYYCVGAQDAAGNTSAGFPDSSCSWLSLLAPIEQVSNGCGGAGWGLDAGVAQNLFLDTSRYLDSNVNPLARGYTVNFREACNLHDAGYGGMTVRDEINGGVKDFRTWSRRLVDNKFSRDMRTLCIRQIPAGATVARANCMAHGGNASIGAESRYDAVRLIGAANFDANLKRPGTQRAGDRTNN